MTLFSESFDAYAGAPIDSTVGIVSGGWINVSGGGGNNVNQNSFQTGRLGGQCLRIFCEGFSGWYIRFYKPLGFQSDVFCTSFAFRGFGQSGPCFVGLGDGSTVQLAVYQHSDGRISVHRGGGTTGGFGVELWTSIAGRYPPGVWHTIRLKGKIHNSTGELAIRIDAEEVANLVGIDTQESGNAWVNSFVVNCREVSVDVDDIVVKDSNVTWLPECRIQQLLPNGDGGTLNLVPSTGVSHFAVVDEPTVNLGDYLEGSLDGEHDLLNVQDLAVVPNSILGVKVLGWAAKTDAASRAWKLGIVSGATTSDGPDKSLTTSAAYLERLLETDPNTGVAWTQAAINAHQLKPTVVLPV